MQNPIFSIKDLKYIKKSNTILNIRNFEIHRGACYMIDGKMASGKSLIINLLTKKIKNYTGKIFYDNTELKKISNSLYKKDIAIVYQITNKPFFGNVKNYILNEICSKNDDGTQERKFNSIIKVMDIKNLLDTKIRNLTPSEFRWVDLAAKIASYPKVLFIDEIELHLSKKNLEALSKILYRKCNYDGVSIIATTQNKEFFYNLISVNITINQGRINKVRSFNHKSKRK